MINGTIVKGIGGFYYVKTQKGIIIECKPRGLFRKDGIVPVVGDEVSLEMIKEDQGVIKTIHERKNELIRPPVSNVDQIVIVIALARPEPNFAVLDKFLVMAEKQNIPVVIVFNKADIADPDLIKDTLSIYQSSGYKAILLCALTGQGVEDIKKVLVDKVSVFAGPSGVGKSTLLNAIQPGFKLKMGDVSEKTERGKHTTRHVELLPLSFSGMVLDTPGFTSFDLYDVEEDELQFLYPEFNDYIGSCKFNGCNHISEPDCAIKSEIENGNISQSRYSSYINQYKEIQEKRRY